MTAQPLVCGFPAQKPVVGHARTAMIRSPQPLGLYHKLDGIH